MARKTRKKVKSLIIVERAFRGSVESQYAHTPWMSRIVNRMGGDTSLVLQGNSVFYAVKDQSNPKLEFGSVSLDTLPDYESALEDVLENKIPVYANAENCRSRGIDENSVIDGVQLVNALQLAELCEKADKIWYW